MPRETFEYQPLENVMRGIEPEPSESAAEATAELAERGVDVARITAAVKSRVAGKLQQHREERRQNRQKLIARDVERMVDAWTHPSIRRFAQGEDPVEKMIAIASACVLEASEGKGKPIVDPFAIARCRSIPVRAREDVADARTIPIGEEGLQIEYNPHRSTARLRFSIAHELAHTFFPDCHEMIRNRLPREEMKGSEWQLEMLCNLGAAELLMPIATFPEIREEALSIDHLMELRRRYEVGVEALLLRVVRLTGIPCAIFTASVRESGAAEDRYGIDYVLTSRSWRTALRSGDLLPTDTIVGECKVIGHTAKGDENWANVSEKLHAECVAIPPYPQHRYPRVAGVVVPGNIRSTPAPRLTEIVGDALELRGSGPSILAYIVNDKTPNWGAGFARAVAKKWPNAQERFRAWTSENRQHFRLGRSFTCEVDDRVWLHPMICQHGYGESKTPRIRYGALKECLDQTAQLAKLHGASVHMPRIGSGYAGGLWPIISQMIDETLCFKGINVTVYNLPGATPEQSPELPGLFKQQKVL